MARKGRVEDDITLGKGVDVSKERTRKRRLGREARHNCCTVDGCQLGSRRRGKDVCASKQRTSRARHKKTAGWRCVTIIVRPIYVKGNKRRGEDICVSRERVAKEERRMYVRQGEVFLLIRDFRGRRRLGLESVNGGGKERRPKNKQEFAHERLRPDVLRVVNKPSQVEYR